MNAFLTTLTAIFFAELADKTQLVTVNMAAKNGKPLAVFAGSVAGYALVTLVSVLLGNFFAAHVKMEILRLVGGGIFILMGVLMIGGKM